MQNGGSTYVEARRNAFDSMPQILSNVSQRLNESQWHTHIARYSVVDAILELPAIRVCNMTDALLDGLTDYTSDERGDVGSWVRIACVKGLASFIRTLITEAAALPSLSDYLPPRSFHDAIGGILKQGVERLDNVRQQAGECFVDLLSLPLPATAYPERWQIQGAATIKGLFVRCVGCKGKRKGAYTGSW